MTFYVDLPTCDPLPQKLSVRRVATTTATPNDTENYPTIELLGDGDSTGVDSGEYDHLFKIVLVGDSGVGKSNLLSRFVRNVYNEEERSTIGVDMMTRHARIHGQGGPVVVKLQIWDSAGQERFRAMSSVFYRNAVAAVIVYDITDKKTFDHVPTWLEEVQKYSEDSMVLLVGNKSDLAHIRAVPKESGHDFATEHGLLFSETSAFDRSNVQPAFINMIKQAFIHFEQQEKDATLAREAAELELAEEEVLDGGDDANGEDGEGTGLNDDARDKEENGAEDGNSIGAAKREPLLKRKFKKWKKKKKSKKNKKRREKETIVLEDDDPETMGQEHRRTQRHACCKKG